MNPSDDKQIPEESQDIPETEAPEGTKVRFAYQHSPQYRAIHATGCLGGIAPHGEVFMYLFQEARPVPFEGQYTVGEERNLIDEEHFYSDDGIYAVREIEVGAFFSPETAITVGQWLQRRGMQALQAKQEMQGSLDDDTTDETE